MAESHKTQAKLNTRDSAFCTQGMSERESERNIEKKTTKLINDENTRLLLRHETAQI